MTQQATTPIDNTADILDSRDINERRTFLAHTERDLDEEVEFRLLNNLVDQGETLDDWEYGLTLIRDTYFTQYAEEYAIDCGLVDPAALWPACYIDWERAAADLQMDYTALAFGETTYWAR